jgi:hypothetical protein
MAEVIWNDAEAAALKGDLARAYRDQVAVPIILPMMRAECPVDTGVLKQQHGVDAVVKVGSSYVIRFRAAPYWGVLVALGHGVIVPVRAKALRFVTKQGKVVFTKRVRAVAGNPWMYRTFVRAGLSECRMPIPPRIAGG